LPTGRLTPGSVWRVEFRLPWISRIARPEGVCRTSGSGFEVGSVLPAGGIEIGIAGISEFGAGIERVARSEETLLMTMICSL